MVKRAVVTLAILACALAALSPRPALGQTLFEKLVMPGELVEKHSHLEKDCASCHASFDKSAQSGLCLKCHAPIAGDLTDKRGFHGRSNAVAGAACKQCHTDHTGRGADIVRFDPAAFDHALTDYLLQGKHATVKCESCHLPTVKFRDAAGTCLACHTGDDPHKGKLGTACASCHSEKSWTETLPFDHGKTRFALAGAHAEIACKACHAGERYKGIPTACIGCHGKDDVHKGRFGPDCVSCHGVAKWTEIVFDHDRQTKFALRGAHRAVKCDACHTGKLTDAIGTTCVACHRKDDVHRGALGPKCDSCHGQDRWRPAAEFDHGRTRFPLTGLHADVACTACHGTKPYKDAPTDCASCHADAFHDGRLGTNCALCHGEQGWPFWRFDHDTQTRYPLTGAHAGVDCHACHKQSKSDPAQLTATCSACHGDDDVHRGSFGRRCERCHDTRSFKGAVIGR